MKHNNVENGLLIGNRIPKDFFITWGKGESDITIHAGSYHLALKDAGIEMCNIITYSSILPSIAKERRKPAKIVHGSVMETIMATASCKKGESCTAGIIFGWLYDKKTGEKYGGLVCEYNGNLPKKDADDQLKESLKELYENGFSEKYKLRGVKIFSENIFPEKMYGTVIIALCFTNYVYPLAKIR